MGLFAEDYMDVHKCDLGSGFFCMNRQGSFPLLNRMEYIDSWSLCPLSYIYPVTPHTPV